MVDTWPVEVWEWTAEEVGYRQNRNLLLTNSPLALGLFYGVRAVGNAAARQRAAQEARPQWRPLGQGQAQVDDDALHLLGPWGNTPVWFSQLRAWHRDGDAVVVSPVGDVPPLLVRTAGVDALAGALAARSQGRLWAPPELETWPPPGPDRVTGWEPADGRFTFALPPGWGRYLDPGYVRLAAQDAAGGGQQLLFLLRFDTMECDAYVDVAELRDPDRLALLAGDPGMLERNAGWVAQARAQKSNGAVTAPPRLVVVGGERASLLSFTTSVPGFAVRNLEFWIPHGGAWFVVGFNVTSRGDPRPWFDHLLGDIQAMVASWHWRF